MARKGGKWIRTKRDMENPLDLAVQARDVHVLDMVAHAVRHRQVMLAYQAVVQSQDTAKVAFYEGLIRIMDETGRIIPAKDFIEEVETTELGRVIDCLALELGLRALALNPGLRLSVNMSARSIGYARWMQVLKRGLANNPTVAERLILEITESSAMLVPELVTSFMGDLQRKGITFAMDDFGSGFTSFRFLRDFFLTSLKSTGNSCVVSRPMRTIRYCPRRLSRFLNNLTCLPSPRASKTSKTPSGFKASASIANKAISLGHRQSKSRGRQPMMMPQVFGRGDIPPATKRHTVVYNRTIAALRRLLYHSREPMGENQTVCPY